MVELSQNMDEIYEQYKNIKTEIGDKEDCDKEKYEHYNILINKVQEEIDKTEKNGETYFKLLAMIVSIKYEQARIEISKEELEVALEKLGTAIELMKEHKKHPQVLYIYLRIANLFSYIQSKNGNLESAKDLLLDAEKLYYSIEDKATIQIYNTEELFKKEVETQQNLMKLEKLVTNNLQMLGWIYNKQNQQNIFVNYHHTVLRRQLENQDGNALTWVLKCARLSSYFLSKDRFKEARHHLAAALVVLQEYEKDLKDFQSDPNFLEEWEELQHYYADVSRYWVKYGLFLFNASRARNMKVYENDDLDKEVGKGDCSEEPETKEAESLLIFPSLNLEQVENQVTNEYITTTDQARALFLYSHTWLKRSEQYYTIHEFTLDYVNTILDLSELYRYLAFYETDIDSQYSVQKRRADALETLSSILRDIRPQCYIAVSIELFRELAEVQMELLALNMQKLYYTDTALSQTLGTVQEQNLRKMEALSDIHTRLETLNERIKFKK